MSELSEKNANEAVRPHACALAFRERFTEDSAQACWEKLKKDGQNMLVAIVIDANSHEVLMQAFQDKAAFVKSLTSGLMHYHSRSRDSLWLKGETSGHFQHISALRVDCDGDSLLYSIEQVGAACHTGAYSCYYRDIGELCYK